MLTTLTMALLLGQFPQASCPTCGNNGMPSAPQGATGWFPLFTEQGWDRIKNVFNGELLGLTANKCPCPLGAPMPNGDLWAMQMHANYAYAPPAAAPAAAPTPPAAPNPTPAQSGAAAPNTAAPATSTLPSLPTGPALPLP